MTSNIELLTKWENLTQDEKEEVLRFVHEFNDEKETKSTVSNQEMSEK